MTGSDTTRRADLLAMGAATLHEAQGRKGALASRIKPIDVHMKLCGPAFTVRCARGDNLALHYAVSVAPAGSILVVDAEGFTEAGLWGDILTEAAQHRGISGLVIDGAVRDVEAIIILGFPVFASGISIGGPGKDAGGEVGRAIHCGGVPVHTGDWVVGDRDGVVAIEAKNLDATMTAAKQRVDHEATVRAGLAEGRSTIDLLGLQGFVTKAGLPSSSTT
jgi:4-hydroxy-4-methyl-2-oxoglutarate aldolase